MRLQAQSNSFDVVFESSHGVWSLRLPVEGATLCDVLTVNRVPTGAVTIYGQCIDGSSKLIPALLTSLDDLSRKYTKIIVRPDRNIDYGSIIRRGTELRETDDAVTEYRFSSEDASRICHIQFTQEECKEYVHKEVELFFSEHVTIETDRPIVLGVSGGGDSNTLMESFLSSGSAQPGQLLAVMILGIPDWDKGRDRAQTLCDKYGVELRFVEPSTINRLLGRSPESDWLSDFEAAYPNTDMEVMGTMAIRLALVEVAKSINAQSIVIGLNTEDLLAECLLRTMQGRLPLPFPIRMIDDVSFWYPLHRVPKRILDGCHPKYSLQNYLDRYPSKMMGRAIPYYLAQMMHHMLPGSEFDFLKGFQMLSGQETSGTALDEQLGIETWDEVPAHVKSKWLLFTQQ